MYLTGFADEASGDINQQIKATKKLGWSNIEARGIDGVNIHDIDDATFDRVYTLLNKNGINVNCFGSTIGNWQKPITDPFDITIAEVERAIPRMQKLGCKLIRVMSYIVDHKKGVEGLMEEERFRRMREIQSRFADAGLTAVHENCGNYGGLSWEYTLKLIDNVPGLKLVFDTGNPVFNDDWGKPAPYPKQSSWEFYNHVKEHIEYVHIKDGRWDAENKKEIYTYPGEGDGDVRKIVKDLLQNGYDGGISIEPHIGTVFHQDLGLSQNEGRYQSYVEYGKRFMKIIDEIKTELAECHA